MVGAAPWVEDAARVATGEKEREPMAIAIVAARAAHRGRRLVEQTRPMSARGRAVLTWREIDRARDRATTRLFGGLFTAGLVYVCVPFLGVAWGWW